MGVWVDVKRNKVVAASQLKLHRVALMGHCCRYRGSRRLFLCNQNHLPMEA